jgi:hypothetical protein
MKKLTSGFISLNFPIFQGLLAKRLPEHFKNSTVKDTLS